MIELNKIYNENCLDTMSRMPDGFIDLTVTSPPYDNLRNYKGYDFDFESIAKELFRVTKKGGVVVWVVNDSTIKGSETLTTCKQKIYFKEVCGFNIHDTMIWFKRTIPTGGNRYDNAYEFMFILSKGGPSTFNPIQVKRRYLDNRKIKEGQRAKDGQRQLRNNKLSDTCNDINVWDIPVGLEPSNGHPAIFPEQVPRDHIFTWSNEGDLVYDCFTGSGTTLKMAHLLKRNWIGSEISPEYCKIAEKRIKPYLMQQKLF